jgi:uncharacterized membrane protein YfcA
MVLLLVGVAGFVASLVDGSLGMGFGVTSGTLLLAAGVAPATVSGTVNVAKVATGFAGGAAHWRAGNVDRRLFVRLAVPGALGAIVGLTVLARVDGDSLTLPLAVFLMFLGARMLLRFSRRGPGAEVPDRPHARPHELGWAFLGGITNGLIGAWGPVVTGALLHRDDIEPRVAIGTVNAAEMVVALTSVTGILAVLGGDGLQLGVLVAIAIGGVLAAPLAAWVVGRVPAGALGAVVGTFLVVTNLVVALSPLDLPVLTAAAALAATVVGSAVAIRAMRVDARRRRFAPAT